jgi:parallel beta-helix repeat protein
MANPLTHRALTFASLAATACALAFASPAAASGSCTSFAAPTGSDAAAGTEAAPYRSAQKLAESLRPGDTGCLRAGVYEGGMTFRAGGTPDAPVTLRNFPGERATVEGLTWVSRTAPHVVVEGLYLNGRNPTDHPSPTVNASDVTFRRNDVTNEHTGICFMLGHEDWGRAVRTVIESNRIHNCGRLPATNFDHGIYISASDDVRVKNNWIYDNADWGVHLYPDAQNTLVEGNVIEGNGKGVTFSGEGGLASNDNTVRGNVIANSTIRFNVESWWPEGNPVPARNLTTGNCLGPSRRDDYRNGGIDLSAAFQAASNKVVANPGYADAGGRDLRLTESSACKGTYSGDNGVPGPDGEAPALVSQASVAPRGPAVTLSARRRAIRRGQRALLQGRVANSELRPGLQVTLIAQGARGGRRAVARAIVRQGGGFAVRPRLRVRPGAVRLQAVVRGIGRSRSIRLSIR